MAKRERDIIAWIFRNFINSLKPRRFNGDLVGTDRFGNKFFEIEADGKGRKRSRYFEPVGKEDGFDNEVSSEWEAWLRGRRREPPTEEEINRNYQIMMETKRKAAEIDSKYKDMKLISSDTPLPKKGIESFPVYSDYEKVPGKPNKE